MDNTNHLLDKLAPILPLEVKRWRSGLLHGTERTRRMIQARIRREATGRFPNGIPIGSLPHPAPDQGELPLGTVIYDKPRGRLHLSKDEILQGLGIWGRSGSGKTNIALLLMEQLATQRAGWVFLDHKRTGREIQQLVPSTRTHRIGHETNTLRFNPFQTPPGVPARAYQGQVIDVLSQTHTLGSGSRHVIEQALQKAGPSPSAQDLVDLIAEASAGERSKGWKQTATRAIQGIAAFMGQGSGEEHGIAPLLQGHYVVELDALSLPEKNFFSQTLLLWIYHTQLNAYFGAS